LEEAAEAHPVLDPSTRALVVEAEEVCISHRIIWLLGTIRSRLEMAVALPLAEDSLLWATSPLWVVDAVAEPH
jgi:hypothetical protein